MADLILADGVSFVALCCTLSGRLVTVPVPQKNLIEERLCTKSRTEPGLR
jgi:hypothetical protein